MRYLVSYDLNTPGKDYDELTDALQRLKAKRVLYSQWALRRNNTSAKGLRDHFWSYMDSNDRILVVQLDGRGWAARNLMTKISKI